jgi:hypothetical protein
VKHDTKNLHLFDINSNVPRHAEDAIEDYILRGFHPGGFLTSVLCGDLFTAVIRADVANKEKLWHITEWLLSNAPVGSVGSQPLVDDWCINKNDVRTDYIKKLSEKVMWDKLRANRKQTKQI